MFSSIIAKSKSVYIFFIVVLLAACGGGGGSSEGSLESTLSQAVSSEPQIFIAGGGIKGPLAFASVELYSLDPSFDELYDPSNPITTAVTNSLAQITGLPVPADFKPPYILVIDGARAIDRNTQVAPVISKLVTVITQESLDSRRPVYATPYTTLAYHMLRLEYSEALSVGSLIAGDMVMFSDQIIELVGFGIDEATNIFSTAPVLTTAGVSANDQRMIADYRAAIEALSSMLHQMHLTNQSVTSDELLEVLAFDLYDDGMINTLAVIGGFVGVLTQDPMAIEIANTRYLVKDTVALMDEERALIGGNVTFQEGISVSLQPIRLASSFNSSSDAKGSTLGSAPNSTAGSATYPQFSQVPVLPGRMKFSWFSAAKALYDSSKQDDPIDWPAVYANAPNTRIVNSCSTLQGALNQANPGDMIMVDPGEYKGCKLSMTRSGTRNQPIVIASKAKALNSSGVVTFSGGETFATFKKAASNYLIGGFRFVGQSSMAFELEPGTVTKDGSGNSVYNDGSTDIRFTDNHYEGIGKATGSAKGVILAGVRSQRIRIDHSSFISNYNNIRFKNSAEDGAHVSASKDGRVDHNYFGPAASSGFISGVDYTIAAIRTCCGDIKEDSDTLTLTFEYNAVEHMRTKYTDVEVVEVKTAGMVVRNNIIWSENANVSLRYAFNATVESNYLVGTGIMVHGANHVISNNYIDGNDTLNTGIEMSRWGRRQPENCTTIAPTHDNLITQNTILDTTGYGLRIGDCTYGACRPVTDSRISNNYLKSSSGVLAHFNTRNEPKRTSVCNAQTTNRGSWRYDKPGDADGGRNSGVDFTANVFSVTGRASNGSAFQQDKKAIVE